MVELAPNLKSLEIRSTNLLDISTLASSTNSRPGRSLIFAQPSFNNHQPVSVKNQGHRVPVCQAKVWGLAPNFTTNV